jgi:hypothetical protein
MGSVIRLWSKDLNTLHMKHGVLAGHEVIHIVAGNVNVPSGRECKENQHCGDRQPAASDRITHQVLVFFLEDWRA